MTAHTIFSLGNLIALTGWAALLAALFVDRLHDRALAWAGWLLPLLRGLAYAALIAAGREEFAQGGGFGSITEVRALFADDWALTAGWFHYLAFDLFVGSAVVREGRERGVSPWLILPALPLTFLLGPVGLLVWAAIRAIPVPRKGGA